jgi:hypothetical protein
MSYQTKADEHPSAKAHWRNFYSARELEIIDLYHSICVPRGWWPLNADSLELHDALSMFEKITHDFKRMFQKAADERDAGTNYTSPRGNKLLRILLNR